MPVEENLMQAILLTFGTAMVPVLSSGRHSCGSGGGTPGRGLPGVHPGHYGAGALYPAADHRIFDAPGHRLFGPRIDWLERRAHLKGRGAEVPPAGTHHSGSHPRRGPGLDGALVAALLDIRMRHAARHLPGRGDCRGHRHHADLRRGAAV